MEPSVRPDRDARARPPGDTSKWIFDLYRIGQSVPRLAPREVQEQILDHIIRGFAADSGCLATVDEGARTLSIADGVVGSTLRFGERILGRVAASRRPLLLNGDLSADPRLAEGGRFPNRAASSLCWPLLIDDRLVGALSINRGRNSPAFTPRDLDEGQLMVNAITLAVDNACLYEDQQRRIAELARLNEELSESGRRLEAAHEQLVQKEKLASLGQLAAGVAHEINNPIGYVNSNVGTMRGYLDQLFQLIGAYEAAEQALSAGPALSEVRRVKDAVNLAYLKEDTRDLVAECTEGLDRVKRIVQDLRDFAHTGEGEWETADLHKGLDSTLNIVHNELKYKAEVVREYGDLPRVECIPGQLNQVFMNLLVNAAHAIEEQGTITVRTGSEDGPREGTVWVEVQDTGSGIPEANLKRLFDPFFTTKPVGEGTGLGLALSYGIVERHGGRIEVRSQVGEGTTFRVTLPVERPPEALAEEGAAAAPGAAPDAPTDRPAPPRPGASASPQGVPR
jgi:two-component system NtrC family sensor kinase